MSENWNVTAEIWNLIKLTFSSTSYCCVRSQTREFSWSSIFWPSVWLTKFRIRECRENDNNRGWIVKKTVFHRPHSFLIYCTLQTNLLSVEQAEEAGEGLETTHGQVETAHDCVRGEWFETERNEFCRHPDGGSWVVQLLWPSQVIQHNSQMSTWFILLNSLSSAFISFSYFIPHYSNHWYSILN